MKEITTSQFNFEDVIKGNFVYVDKTDLLARLASTYKAQFFISRPRRFGKSLMLSTLKCLFEGRKDLFEGLKVMKTDYDWKTYPVLHLDMGKTRAETVEDIAVGLNGMVVDLARQLTLEVKEESSPALTFENLWRQIRLHDLQVVVLVDEYDIPLQGFLNDAAALERIRQLMHDFYIRLKSYSGNIRFLMLTGVTKLAKLSVFSGLNNLTDLTMEADYAELLGYTHEELDLFFSDHIAAFAAEEGISSASLKEKLLERYDNYRFSPKSDVRVLNPVSVGSALRSRELADYWNATGAPSLVIEALKRADKWPSDLEKISVQRSQLDVCDAQTMPVVPLLYQGGYLTIKESLPGGLLRLGIPNEEVRAAITMGHINSLIGDNKGIEFNASAAEAALELDAGNLDAAIGFFRSTVASLPYEWLIKDEGAVKVAFLDFFGAARGAKLTAEREIANGRIDAIIETKDAVYIFEFKYNRTAQEAFDQILDKGYHLPYLTQPNGSAGTPRPTKEITNSTTQLSTLHSPLLTSPDPNTQTLKHSKTVFGIGLNFNPANGTRGIDDPVVKQLA